MASSRLRKVRGSHNALDMDTESVASKAMQRDNENSIRLCQRIWSGYTKFIRSQCNKDRVIDSMFFGSFFKREDKLDDVGEDMKKNTSKFFLEFRIFTFFGIPAELTIKFRMIPLYG